MKITDEMVNLLAGEFAAVRVGGKMNIYMGGEHNPRPYEIRLARDVLQSLAALSTAALGDVEPLADQRITELEAENRLLKNCLSESMLMGDEATMIVPGRGTVPLAEFLLDKFGLNPGDVI